MHDAARSSKKRVTYETFKKWQLDFDRECSTMMWLHCETGTEGGKKSCGEVEMQSMRPIC